MKDRSIGRLYILAGPWSCSHAYNTYIHTCTPHCSPTTQQHPLTSLIIYWIIGPIVWLRYCLLISSWSSIQSSRSSNQWRGVSFIEQRFSIENSHIVSIIIHQSHPILLDSINGDWNWMWMMIVWVWSVVNQSTYLFLFNCCVCLQFL